MPLKRQRNCFGAGAGLRAGALISKPKFKMGGNPFRRFCACPLEKAPEILENFLPVNFPHLLSLAGSGDHPHGTVIRGWGSFTLALL